MRKLLFRILGTLHGLAGVFTLAIVVHLYSANGSGAFMADVAGTVGGALIIIALVICMFATWLRPERAPLFALLAAPLYFFTGALGAYQHFGASLFGNLIPNFYYSSAIRFVAALLLLFMSRQIGQGSNNSFKPNLLRYIKSVA